MTTMPAIFLGHGSFMNVILENQFSQQWNDLEKNLKKLGYIVIISTHWYAKGTFRRVADTNPQIYDFYGFPKDLYDLKYEAQLP